MCVPFPILKLDSSWLGTYHPVESDQCSEHDANSCWVSTQALLPSQERILQSFWPWRNWARYASFHASLKAKLGILFAGGGSKTERGEISLRDLSSWGWGRKRRAMPSHHHFLTHLFPSMVLRLLTNVRSLREGTLLMASSVPHTTPMIMRRWYVAWS